RPEQERGLPVKPCGGRCRSVRIESLRHETTDKAGEYIAGTGGRQCRRRMGVNGGKTARRCDDGICAFEEDGALGHRRRSARSLNLVLRFGQHPFEESLKFAPV